MLGKFEANATAGSDNNRYKGHNVELAPYVRYRPACMGIEFARGGAAARVQAAAIDPADSIPIRRAIFALMAPCKCLRPASSWWHSLTAAKEIILYVAA